MTTAGSKLGEVLKMAQAQQQVVPFLGGYDLFSAFGLPDIGFIGWGDLTTTSRLRALLPDHHLLVDIDDGFGDATVASHLARTLERCGASGVVLEDQARPRRCGHLDGKKLLPLQEYLVKLEALLQHRSSLIVVARTDASDPGEILNRVRAFVRVGCDAVLADGIKDLTLIAELRQGVRCPVFCNVIGGGKVPACSRADLARQGVQGLIYSTTCRFAAQEAIERALDGFTDESASFKDTLSSGRQLSHCNAILKVNLRRAGAA